VRLLRHDVAGEARVAIVAGDETVVDIEGVAAANLDLDALRTAAARSASAVPTALEAVRLLPPVAPGKIVAVGRNYREHAAEEDVAAPEDPLLFAKFPTAVIADGVDVTWSASLAGEVDYEAELAVVIGRRARHVTEAAALDHVLGYTCLNDVSARDLQWHDGQWVRAKSLDTFCPLGPWIVTADEIADPGRLRIRCRVNGEVRQDASTADLIHGVAELIAFCSRSFTLEPGDVIATGTPGGVGVFRDPPVYLRDGDVVEVEIERIGTLRNRCRVLP
jgi:2-keto-4-pentenoate hydratase/2-oxohepta-3-ene-1,7-dioic acid hydratase in catechol pathway